MNRFGRVELGRWAIAVALIMTVGAVDAGPRGGMTGQRDVISDAGEVCDGSPADQDLQDACDLLENTNGEQIMDGMACDEMFDEDDNMIVDYKLRNCDKNEEALLRKAASAVLSLDDFIAGKAQQKQKAADYLCSYADKFMILESAGKLESTMDLAADAENIVSNLGLACD